ncbi:MAG: patatin-like phospholipase family protein [Deltaproteobacteria bacterium]|nr:patatin-like phospholipase family protein [Deltaproteobacteria bacterium]
MPSSNQNPKLGLVLSAGGARAAYQVGVLRYIGQHFPHFRPRVFSGVSAGSIIACYLAQGEPLQQATLRMYELWAALHFDQVLKTNFNSMLSLFLRWFWDLFLSKMTDRLLVRALLDASPLSRTLLSHIHFWKIARAIRSGEVDGLAISATNYFDGMTTVFYDSFRPIPAWRREKRIAVRSAIRIRHIMASCSIPLLFEPVRIGDSLFGDGSLRLSFPLSPSIHLGATHLLTISIRCPNSVSPVKLEKPEQLSMGFIAGTVLNSIFLDSLEADHENMVRMNQVYDGKQVKRIESLLIRPSLDLGAIAKEFIGEIPFHFRQVVRALATSPAELGDLMSYLMFTNGYLNALLELGQKDAKSNHDQIEQLLASACPVPSLQRSSSTGD